MKRIKNKSEGKGGLARLDGEDRSFFTQIVQTIRENPFGDEREKIMEQVAPGSTHLPVWKEHHLSAIGPALDERLNRLERKGLTTLQQFNEEDRPVLGFSYLLQAYLLYREDMNEVIQSQLNLGATPVKVPFAKSALAKIKGRGFSDQDSLRYFAVFYQLYRAHYFISQDLVGESSSMKRFRFNLWNNVFTYDMMSIYNQHLLNRMEDFSTLLLGETGTGLVGVAEQERLGGHVK